MAYPVTVNSREALSTAKLEETYLHHRDKAYAIALQIIGDGDEAADLVQEAYLKAQKKLRSFRGEASIQTWFLRIVVNLALKGVRRRQVRRRLRYFITQPPTQPTPEWLAGSNEQLRLLGRSLEALPGQQRAAFVLRHAHDMTMAEVAQLMQVSIPTAKTHLRRATDRLRREVLHGA